VKRAHEQPEYDDRDRMIAATERLAALLEGAGPNIVVTPVGDDGGGHDTLPENVLRHLGPGIGDLVAAEPDTATPPQQPGGGRPRGRIVDAVPATPPPAKRAPRKAADPKAPPAAAEAPARAAARTFSRLPQSPPAAGRPAAAADAARHPPVLPAPSASPPTAGARPHSGGGELAEALRASRRAFLATGGFSFVINVLMLTGPLFMLQVYDRVLTSGSISTLVALSAMTAALYGIIGYLELVRSRIVVRIGAEVDGRIGDRVFEASLRRSVVGQGTSLPALRELDTLRQFLASQGPLTFFDAPWTPIYLAVIFMLHWTLGIAATIGAALLFAIAVLSEARSRTPLAAAGKAAFKSLELAETGQRNAEAITAMGMLGAYRERWQQANRESLAWQIFAADRLGGMSALSKSLRLLLQSLMLAIGAALAINGHISAGAIVAGTIIFGRALAPVEQAIGQWRQFLKARESYEKLDELLRKEPPQPARTSLPAPKGILTVTGLRVASPETRQVILSGLAFEVKPGQMLAVIGPSASGKSTLARTLVGLWPAASGQVKLDGARIDQWSQEALGRHIGYLPQNVELFAGTVADNIARFQSDASDADIVAAATQAHAHEMILALPEGYQTQLGAFGTYLSAGQRQRIGLARALYGNPALVVLDEPNSNLDRSGDEALASAVGGMRRRGQTVVLVSHRVQAIGMADLLLYLDRGTQRAFGPRDEVMKLFQGASNAQTVERGRQPAAAVATPPADVKGGAA
jgi:PrtD family type I secretion system ABC transporter